MAEPKSNDLRPWPEIRGFVLYLPDKVGCSCYPASDTRYTEFQPVLNTLLGGLFDPMLCDRAVVDL